MELKNTPATKIGIRIRKPAAAKAYLEHGIELNIAAERI